MMTDSCNSNTVTCLYLYCCCFCWYFSVSVAVVGASLDENWARSKTHSLKSVKNRNTPQGYQLLKANLMEDANHKGVSISVGFRKVCPAASYQISIRVFSRDPNLLETTFWSSDNRWYGCHWRRIKFTSVWSTGEIDSSWQKPIHILISY